MTDTLIPRTAMRMERAVGSVKVALGHYAQGSQRLEMALRDLLEISRQFEAEVSANIEAIRKAGGV